MAVIGLLKLLNWVGILSAIIALFLIAYTLYLAIQANPAALKQRIMETKPQPPPKPIPMKRVVKAKIPEEQQLQLNALFQDIPKSSGWQSV